ncbi:MAG: DUF2325 domain-containing protein [Nitrospirota bacterium]|jgi:hypothetical protein
MSVVLVGGMNRLKRHYVREADRLGISLKVYNSPGVSMRSGVRNVDAVVMFTNKVSHRAKREVELAAREKDIPVYMHHSCGVCTLRDCLRCLKKGRRSRHRS